MAKNPAKPHRSIFLTQIVSYLLIIIVTTLTFSLLFFSTAKNHLEREVGQKLQDIARIAARNAPFERLDLIKVGDDQTRMVLRLKEKFGEIREATGVSNIMVFRTDKTSLLDLRPEIRIGSPYTLAHFQGSFLNELKHNRAVGTGSYRMPDGKLFISAYAPVMDSGGHLLAVVGVNSGAREVEVIEQMRTRLYLVAGVGAILAFVVALFLARTLTKPIRLMAETAEKIGKGEYEARVKIPGAAELGVLAGSINEMAQQVQRRDAKLKEMSASVAHEIRNPLNSIKLLITLLGEELQEQQGVTSIKALDTLHYEIGKLNRFLTEFLTYSRPITLVKNDVNPLDLAKSAADMASAEAADRGVTIEVASQASLPALCVDRERMEQSLLNIVLNAVHACQQGGAVILKIEVDREAGRLDFIVDDSGPGITPEVADRLFEPFFTTKQSGTGLGLSNVEKIVKSHGGVIFAENIQACGCRFVVRLPLGANTSKE